MGTLPLHPLFPFRGRVGDFVYKWYGKKVVITRVPRFTKPATKHQRTKRKDFAAAARFAQGVVRDPVRKGLYAAEAKKRRLSVYHVALGDHLRAVVLDEVLMRNASAEGYVLEIKTTRDCPAATVQIEVRRRNGRRLESGAGEQGAKPWQWVFRGRQPLTRGEPLSLIITTHDRAGRAAKFRLRGAAASYALMKPLE
jgi:hypothetical protein